MKGLRQAPLVSLLGASAALVFALVPALASGQTVKPNVTVVNTAANPVPVTGTVTSQVTGSVNATQSGTWNVGITGTPTVAISGSVATYPEEQPADTAVQFDLSGPCASDSYTVPAGNRLVIEFVSAYSIGTAGNDDGAVALQIKTRLNGSTQVQYLPMQRTLLNNGGNPYATFANAVPMIAYADENTVVCFDYAFVLNGPVGVPRAAITGHLVAQP